MKIIRHGAFGAERPGFIDANGNMRDLSAHLPDWTGAMLSPSELKRIAALATNDCPVVPEGTRLGCPISGVRNVIAVGLNYIKHAQETGNQLPAEPLLFNKHTACLCGPNDDILRPPGANALDWEVELAVIIGTPAWHVSEADALNYVAGYALANDVSERDWQNKRSGQWTKGKSYPSWAPIGPFLLTSDEVPNPHDIALTLDVNGVRRQDGNTDDLNFNVPTLVSAISELMGLLPGDIVLTGTPAGVGLGFKPPIFLQTGDKIVVGSSILGEQRTVVVDYNPATAAALHAKIAAR
jgi:2,4-didehydro-3-deoxy-L-rhamnonate hydrolase